MINTGLMLATASQVKVATSPRVALNGPGGRIIPRVNEQ